MGKEPFAGVRYSTGIDILPVSVGQCRQALENRALPLGQASISCTIVRIPNVDSRGVRNMHVSCLVKVREVSCDVLVVSWCIATQRLVTHHSSFPTFWPKSTKC